MLYYLYSIVQNDVFIDVSLSIFTKFIDAIILLSKSKRENIMISYKPFWVTLNKSSESTYTLIHKHNINPTTINRLRNNQPITTTTLNDLCTILKCSLEEIAEFVPEEKP